MWDAMCGQTWAGKVHVAQGAVDLRGMASSAREALRLSLADARRTELTDEELVAFEWRFRFKEQAGPQWQLHDPYWTKHEASLVKFTPSRRRSPGRLHILNFPLVVDRHAARGQEHSRPAGQRERQPGAVVRDLAARR